jgi:phosphate/sulfate permease
VGWKRIVVTVSEKIGQQHLTYAQGASAEIIRMATIEAADQLGLPVSTTHVLSSGVGATMAAKWLGLAVGRCPQPGRGLGLDVAFVDHPIGIFVLAVLAGSLIVSVRRWWGRRFRLPCDSSLCRKGSSQRYKLITQGFTFAVKA